MSEIVHCSDCGYDNPPGSSSCGRCNFPLAEGASGVHVPPVDRVTDAPPPVSGVAAPAEPERPDIRHVRPARPRRPGPRGSVPVSLWLGVGAFIALLLVLIAVQANLERNDPQVDGSNQNQQKAADTFRAALEQDSTDTRARVGLADILFDTGNWSEAIVHYSSAVRQDSTLLTAIVDLGVCYYNLGVADEAERLFQRTLAQDPHQPFALFNLGIVYERRGDNATALRYFHSALQSSPPENMKPAVMEAMQRVAQATGKQAPPLDEPK